MGEKLNSIKQKSIIGIILFIVSVIVFFIACQNSEARLEPKVINKATLEKVIHTSDVSTFEAVYNGIAKVMNKKNIQQVDYYVSYASKIKVGFDFTQIDIMVDKNEKVITVSLPEIKINDINVDITSLDYIFENNKANTSTVSEEAYKECIEDVTTKSKQTNKIYELAEQNAHNIIEALLLPFVEQLEGYQLQIK